MYISKARTGDPTDEPRARKSDHIEVDLERFVAGPVPDALHVGRPLDELGCPRHLAHRRVLSPLLRIFPVRRQHAGNGEQRYRWERGCQICLYQPSQASGHAQVPTAQKAPRTRFVTSARGSDATTSASATKRLSAIVMPEV